MPNSLPTHTLSSGHCMQQCGCTCQLQRSIENARPHLWKGHSVAGSFHGQIKMATPCFLMSSTCDR